MTYYFDNKFVLTEDVSYFFPYRREFCFPLMMRTVILGRMGRTENSPSKSECSFLPTTRRLRAGFRQHQAHILSLRKSLIHDQSHNLWITLGGATPSIVSE
jgi:hypothetical protein